MRPSAAILFLLATVSCSKPQVPEPWSTLGVPTRGLKKVSSDTNEHGYYADYAGRDASALRSAVSDALRRAGYAPACDAVEGQVKGFTKGDRQLAMKIDVFEDVLALSLFDEQGKDPMLHGVCFGQYQLGPAKVIER